MKTAHMSLLRTDYAAEERRSAEQWSANPPFPEVGRLLLRWGATSGAVVAASGAINGVRDYRFAGKSGAEATISLSRDLIALLCERRFGAPAQGAVTPKTESTMERRMADDFAAAVVEGLPARGWRNVAFAPLTVGLDLAFRVAGLPIDSVHFKIVASRGVFTKDSERGDCETWTADLAKLANFVRVPVRAVLARPTLSAGEIARLQPGDVIPVRASDRVRLISGSQILATGRIVEIDGHAAVNIAPFTEANQ